jgi:DNA-binding NarL/FixJ family response regulator
MIEPVAPIRVVVADDHPIFREGLVATLSRRPDVEVVGEAADGQAALEAIAEHQPDVVLMDLRMPGLGGLEATRQISANNPGTSVVVLTMNDDDDSLFAALRAGARGYVLKEAGRDEVYRAVVAVAQGDAVFAGPAADRLRQFFSTAPALGTPAAFPGLTPREREILDLVARGLDNASIARRLFLSDKTVRNSVSAVVRKIGASTRAEAVVLARQQGLGAD